MGSSESRISQQKPKQLKIDRYVINDFLTQTNNSNNFRATDTLSQKSVVIKIIKTQNDEIHHRFVTNELAITSKLRRLAHPNIIEPLDIFKCEQWKCIVTPLAHSTLFAWIPANSESMIRQIMGQLLKGIDHLHSNGIAHRDIKPQNIFVYITNQDLSSPRIVIADFGLAVERKNLCKGEIVGTPAFRAPEMWSGTGGFEMDLWSAGIVMYMLMTGTVPFFSTSEEQMEIAVTNHEIPFPVKLLDAFSRNCVDFLKELLKKDWIARISAAAALKHPWFDTFNVDSSEQQQLN
jgi:serine/threonine protein kinase